MLLGSTDTTKPHDSEEKLIVSLINNGQYAEAWLLLKAEDTSLVATQINLALCHMAVQRFAEAIDCLDNAMQALKSKPAKQAIINDLVYSELLAEQNKSYTYLLAITSEYAEHFPEILTDTIIRLKIDCLRELKQWQPLTQLAKPLEHKLYHNVTEALNAAEQLPLNHEQ